jgi:diguanylate cyclase (GGDEF)-like protein
MATPHAYAHPFPRQRRVAHRVIAAILLFLCLTFWPVSPALADARWADLAEISFQNYGREQGLPHPVPIALVQDGDGFLWVGTQGGLARWDGYRFHSYAPDPAAPGSLPDGWVRTLHLDAQKQLWIGTNGGGLVRYDRAQDRFVPVPVGPAGPDRVHVSAIADDGAGGLWVGTGSTLVHLAPGTAEIMTTDQPAGLPEGGVLSLLHDGQDRLWIGTETGLGRLDGGRFTAVPLPDGTLKVTALAQDDNGRIWIGTANHGAYRLEAGAIRPVVGTASDTVSAIAQSGPHEVWIATRGDGILALDTAAGTAQRIHHDRTRSDSLAHDDVWALLQDSAGSMWAGGTGGLSYHTRGLGAVSTLFGAGARADGISEPDVYSVLPTKDGKVWLGFMSGGVDILDPTGTRVAQLRPDATRPDAALPNDVVTTMAEAGGGDVYVGTVRGIYRVDGHTRQASLVTLPGRDPHAWVNSLLLDDGVLWVAGYNDGLWGGRPGSDTPLFGLADSAKLNDRSVNSLVRGPARDLWIGTSNGLDRLDLDTHAIERIEPDPANPAGFPARFVSSMLIDRQGRLWAGTYGGGIAVMTGRAADGRAQFRRLGPADGLPHLNVDKLLLDGTGQVWAGTDDGLAVIDPTSFAIRALHRAEGSPLGDYFDNAGAVDQAGAPLFGAKGGLTVVQADRLEAWSFRPPVVVSDLRVGGDSVPIGRFNGAGLVPPLMLKPDGNSLAVEFAALDFTAPERNRYAYRLEGFDKDWIETDPTRRLAAYTNLPPGRYRLHLRGTNRDGVWTQPDRIIPIRVLPAWYQTWWFMAAAAALGLAMVATIVRSRTAYLRRHQAALERQIVERTADLSSANRRLFELATIDPLTGCANRRHFIERAHELVALGERHALPVSLIIMDLDHFKRVNDTHGHPAGDEVLRLAGRTSRDHIRAADLLGRIGGEEFALLMPHTSADGARLFADRLRQAIGEAEAEIDGGRVRITVSLGLAERRPGESFDQLYARADAALYAAKAGGRNRVFVDAAD